MLCAYFSPYTIICYSFYILFLRNCSFESFSSVKLLSSPRCTWQCKLLHRSRLYTLSVCRDCTPPLLTYTQCSSNAAFIPLHPSFFVVVLYSFLCHLALEIEFPLSTTVSCKVRFSVSDLHFLFFSHPK